MEPLLDQPGVLPAKRQLQHKVRPLGGANVLQCDALLAERVEFGQPLLLPLGFGGCGFLLLFKNLCLLCGICLLGLLLRSS